MDLALVVPCSKKLETDTDVYQSKEATTQSNRGSLFTTLEKIMGHAKFHYQWGRVWFRDKIGVWKRQTAMSWCQFQIQWGIPASDGSSIATPCSDNIGMGATFTVRLSQGDGSMAYNEIVAVLASLLGILESHSQRRGPQWYSSRKCATSSSSTKQR